MGQGVAVVQVAAAAGRLELVLANDGRFQELREWEGQEIEEPRRLLSESTARQITLFLSDPSPASRNSTASAPSSTRSRSP